jgi:hypothetical protein
MVAVNVFRIRLRTLGALAYARRAPVIFFRVRPSVRPSMCLHNQLGSHAKDFGEIRYLRLLSKFVYKNPNSVYIGQKCGTLSINTKFDVFHPVVWLITIYYLSVHYTTYLISDKV